MCSGDTKQIMQALLLGPMMSLFDQRKFRSFTARPDKEDLASVGKMIETNRVKAVIDRRYPLERVADAIRYFEQGQARGRVVITIVWG